MATDDALHNPLFNPLWVSVLLVCAFCSVAQAQNVILYLKGGDRISGRIVSEYTNRVVVSNSWTKEMSVPLAAIVQREVVAAKDTNRVSGTKTISKIKLPTPPPPRPLFKHWKGEIEVGLDFTESTTDQRTYHARFKLSYERPYVSNPTNFFRNSIDYEVAYGKITQRTQGKTTVATSSDSMGVSDKTSMDFDARWYGYNLGGVGYDHVRNIDLFGEEGPGLGYHALSRLNLTANVESGVDYQIQYNSDKTHSRDFFLRIADDITWKLTPRTTITEKAEFFPRIDLAEFRLRAEATLSYNVWRYVYWNTTVRDNYDTTPAAKVQGNEFEIHSALGVRF